MGNTQTTVSDIARGKARTQAGSEAQSLNDSVNFYRDEVGQVDLLSTEEVTHLAQLIERGQIAKRRGCLPGENEETEEAKEARRQLIEANLRLVLYVARRYQGLGVDIMDLVQEGNLGLMHAVEKFDYTKGCKFSTYAIWWIRHYILRAMAAQVHTIRLPQYRIEEINRLVRTTQHLQQGLKGEPTLDELAEQMNMDVEQVGVLLSMNQETMSLDMPYQGDGDEISLSEMLEDDPRYSPERIVIAETLQAQVQDLLSHLTQRERKVLELRYGLNSREHSLTEISRKLGLSHETVRQVEFRALRKLDHPSRDRMLQDFLR